jgi:low affinity Fe/Cu permease
MFGFSDIWQLVINTGTTIVTFLMVFLIQAALLASAPLWQARSALELEFGVRFGMTETGKANLHSTF